MDECWTAQLSIKGLYTGHLEADLAVLYLEADSSINLYIVFLILVYWYFLDDWAVVEHVYGRACF